MSQSHGTKANAIGVKNTFKHSRVAATLAQVVGRQGHIVGHSPSCPQKNHSCHNRRRVLHPTPNISACTCLQLKPPQLSKSPHNKASEEQVAVIRIHTVLTHACLEQG